MKKIIIILLLILISFIGGVIVTAKNVKMADIYCDEDGIMVYYTIFREEFSYYFEC